MNATSNEAQPSSYEVEVREILGKLDQVQRDIIVDWLGRQHRLETEGDKGYSNVSVVGTHWLTGRSCLSGCETIRDRPSDRKFGNRPVRYALGLAIF